MILAGEDCDQCDRVSRLRAATELRELCELRELDIALLNTGFRIEPIDCTL